MGVELPPSPPPTCHRPWWKPKDNEEEKESEKGKQLEGEEKGKEKVHERSENEATTQPDQSSERAKGSVEGVSVAGQPCSGSTAQMEEPVPRKELQT